MYSNGQTYNPLIKPRPGCFMNKGLSINKGLVGCWLMNEGAGSTVQDLSGNGNVGTLTGTAPSWSAGKFGSAVLLPGTDEYIDCGTFGNIFNGESAVTVVFSIYWNEAGKIPNAEYPGNIGLGSNADRQLWIYGYSNRMSLQCTMETSSGPGQINLESDNCTAKAWNHVAFVWDGTTAQFYHEGRPGANTDTSTGVMISNSGESYLGLIAGNQYWNGNLGYVYIYNRALTASEIQQLYRDPFCGYRWTSIIQLASYVAAAGGGASRRLVNGGLASGTLTGGILAA